MNGIVRFFNRTRGWGFISSNDKDYFVHYTSIKMDGYRYLNENDIVSFEVGTCKDGREQTVNVTPILTVQMVIDALKDENLYVNSKRDSHGIKKYVVSNKDNEIMSNEEGMSFMDLVAYAGFSINEEVA